MSTYLTIVTGTSRGLGAAMAEELLQADSVVLGISRLCPEPEGHYRQSDKSGGHNPQHDWHRALHRQPWPPSLEG